PALGLVSQPLAQGMLTAQLAGVPGIQNNTRIALYNTTLLTVDGQAPPEDVSGLAALPNRNRGGNNSNQRRPFNVSVQVRQSTQPSAPQTMIAGRDLTADDQGKDVLVVTQDWAQSVGANLGSTLELYSGGVQKRFQIVGISAAQGRVAFGKVFAPPGTLSGNTDIQFNILQVDPADLNAVLLKLSENPLVFALDISFIDSLLSRIIGEFSAIPTVVGLLSLLAAAVAMANTVSLQTLERRRQIGVLKAVGLKGRRVLLIMLLENTLIGLLGGLLGLGLSALIVSGMTQAGTGVSIPIPANAMPIAIALIVASVLIAWASTFLSASAAVREHVANVLRYD
ncbi:MAG TPA: ABC transporter permease, partial [Phototrophicaceae bacterium]|nr:ABC transporter permease [Phototrophicaceae bacterium]